MKKLLSALFVASFALSGAAFGDHHEGHEGETHEEHQAHTKKTAKKKKPKVNRVKKAAKKAPPKEEEIPTLDGNLEDAAPAPADVQQ